MSGRPTSAKNKRSDRDGPDSHREGKSKHDLRSDYYGSGYSPGGKPRSGTDRSPTFRGDRRRGRGQDHDRGGSSRRDDRGYGRNYSSRSDMRVSHSESGDDRGDEYRKHDTKAFADDSRLSKLVKKINREDDRDRRINVAKQLKEYLLQPENAKNVTKVSDSLFVALLDVLYERTYKDVKLEMASCIGLLGYTVNQDVQKYVEWLFRNLSAAQQDDVKIFLLSALLETLKQDAVTQKFLDVMPLVMTHCQGVLESADHPDLLVAVVDIVLYVTKDQPEVFASHFRDSVDILVGWHIDATQKDSLTTYTANALVSFHQFWVSDMNFSVTLLGQFLEDMEAYAEDLLLGLQGQSTDEEMPSPDECITKISALLRVFTTVMKSLGEYFMPDKGPAVTVEFMVEIMERTLRCVDGVLKVMYCEKVYMAANKCVHLLCTNLGAEVMRVCDVVTEYLVQQSRNTRIASSPYLLSFLHLTHKVIEQMSTQLPVPVLTQLLGSDSLLHKLRMTRNNEVLTEVMSLHHVILSVKSVPLIEEAYRFLLSDLEVAFNTLLAAMESDEHCGLVRANPLSEVTYSTRQAETAIVYDLCALAEVGNTKNNVIGMWALSPSLFALLSSHLLPLDPALMERYPAVQYALLQTLYSHCSRHGHFISSSHLITRNTILEGTLLANVSPATSGHFTTVLALLEDLLSSQSTPYDSRVLALKWTQDIVDALQTSQHMYQTEEFHDLVDALITSGFSSHSEISLAACNCLQNLINHTSKIGITVQKRCHDLCCVRLSHTSKKTRSAYQTLINSLPLEVTTTNHQYGPEEMPASRRTGTLVTSSSAVWQARRGHISRVPMGTFHSHNYRAVLGYLLHGITPNKSGGTGWLDQMYLSSQRSDKDNPQSDSQNDLGNLIGDNESLLWFWATWEAAQFCILSKLRTPLGKPQETFTAIEAAIKQYAAEARSQDSEDEGLNKPTTDHKGTGVETGSTISQRIQLLLQFMEHLEKQLYNAYEGCAVAMVSPPKMVRTFFRTNRGTCLEWLARVRHGLVTVAKHCGEPTAVVRHTFEMLQEMKDNNKVQTAEFEQLLVTCVEALTELHCPEVLLGLYTWCKDVLGKKLAWIKAAADVASGRYESANTNFKSSLRHYTCPDPQLEETRETASSPNSQSSTPSGSPKHITDGLQRLSLLSRQGDHTGAVNGRVGGSEGPDPKVITYMVSQVSESYKKLCRWDDVLQWQETVKQYRTEHSGTSLQAAFTLKTDINFIQALARFDGLDYEGARESLELVPGGSLHELGDDSPKPLLAWGPSDVLDFTNKQYLRTVTAALLGHLPNQSESMLQCLETCQQWCEGVQRAGCLQWPAQIHSGICLQLYSLSLCRNQLNLYQTAGTNKALKPKLLYPLCEEVRLDPEQHDLGAALQALYFIDTQQQLQDALLPEQEKPIDLWSVTSKLRISTVNLARKQQNLSLAENLLIDEVYGAIRMKSESDKQSESEEGLSDVLIKLQNSRENLTQVHSLRLEREGVKLLRNKGPGHIAVETLCSTVLHHCETIMGLSPAQNRDQINVCSDLNARAMLSLVQWLQTDSKYLSSLTTKLKLIGQEDEASVSRVVHNVSSLLELEKRGKLKPTIQKTGDDDEEDGERLSIEDNPIFGESDIVVGRLYHLATLQSPDLAKAWFSLAGWCYKWGRKAVDHATHGSVDLSTDEKAQILDLLPKGISNEETENALTILSQIHTGSSSEEDISDQDQTLYDDGAETTRRQLLSSCLSLQIASDDCVDRLIDLWRGVVQRVYHYYQLSARAYFTYLRLNGQSTQETNMDGNITATLRVLRLLVKHAWELRGVLEDGLAHTPTNPWKGIIPQLFSRLNHPEPYVRQSVSDLLCRVAQDAPHLIVYPAVVGCSSAKVKDADRDGLLNKYLSQTEDDAENDAEGPSSQSAVLEEDSPSDDTNTAFLENCFTTIVDTLANTNPSMISEVQLLVSELRRITLLWDELWLGTLNQHHGDVSRRLQQLDNEVKKVNNNSSLSKEEKAAIIREKHKTVIKPTLYTMERLWEITSQPAETAHETWFQETYGQLIQDGLAKLREPTDPGHPSLTWQHFKQLHHSLQQRAQKRTSLVLNMEEISSKLASLRNTVIAMPGLSSAGQVVTIEAIHHTVQILPTKTKPKKLVFMGSDGKKYAYLFKGLEDLHLDERIMQFLAIVNNMFAKANRMNSRLYHARHYSVTPLGARSGLIQWVDGATPLFSLYKRWQQREATALQLKQQNAGQTVSGQPAIARPSEVFYSKLTPALKEKGLAHSDNRKEWPLSVMRRVLDDLVTETPRHLLAKELWCSATSAREWWQITQTYARSTAVMSMIGYIIGLGDRHLDNVLVDLATGEVVHIDYNVCFEKGKSLRVPEKVPFRMTQNLEAALGVTGIEGIFRSCCEYVIRTMRRGRETLLTLLEAFVYDPLVDWTTGNEGGYTGAFYGGHTGAAGAGGQQSKRDMERDITLSMFSIRMAEMRSSWTQNRDSMLAALPKLESAVKSHLDSIQTLHEADTQTEKLTEQQRYLQEALDDPEHVIYSLPKRYGEYEVVMSTKTGALEAVQEKLNESETWRKAHQYAMDAIKHDKLQKMCADITKPLTVSLNCFDIVTDFLNGAGQSQLVSQCEVATSELTTAVQQRRMMLKSCLEILHKYATIVVNFPRSYTTESRTARWQQWLQELICNFSREKCTELEQLMERHYSTVLYSASRLQDVLNTEARLERLLAEVTDKVVSLVQRRSHEGAELGVLNAQVQETSSDVHTFMTDTGTKGTMCMTSMVVTALCSLSKRYLVMEGAAAGAGERLMDLTSREGDWFLDELCSMSGNVRQLLNLLNDPTLTQLLSASICQHMNQAMQSVHTVYMALQDLNVNFRTIILPEAVKTLQAEEPSVVAVMSSLEQLVQLSDQPLDSLIEQLELQLINAIMGIVSSDNQAVAAVKQMRQQFDGLLSGSNPGLTSDLSPGQMLLMGFNGLFTRLGSDFDAMLEATARIQAPDAWKKVDIVSEAKSIQLTAFNDSTVGLLSHLFFVKQLKAMTSFFSLTQKHVKAINDCDHNNIHEEESLARPIKLFIAEYVRKHMIGLPSQTLGYILCHYVNALRVDVTAEIELRDIGAASKVSLEELCKKAVDLSVKNGVFDSVDLTQASTLVAANDLAWRKADLASRLDKNVQLLEASRQRAQLQLARFQWLQEDGLSQAGRAVSQHTAPDRTTVMADLNTGIQTLEHLEKVVVGKQEQHVSLEASVTQRLKWAAGANPSLSLILQQFEDCLANKNVFVQTECSLAAEVISIGKAVLHFEVLRSDAPEAIEADEVFRTLLGRCQEACAILEACKVSVSDLELEILQAKPLMESQQIDASWISSRLADLSTDISTQNTGLEQINKNVDASKDGVHGMVNEIRSILTTHHKLMSDIRTILKSMAKQEEQDYGNEVVPGGIREYVHAYKIFSEKFTTMMKLVMVEDLTPAIGQEIEEMIATLAEQIVSIYEHLMTFAPPLTYEQSSDPTPQPSFATAVKRSEVSSVVSSPKRLPLSAVHKPDLMTGTSSGAQSPQTTSTLLPKTTPMSSKKPDKVTRDPRTGKAIQERNSYAVGVWRRVKSKLDGRDPDLNKRLSVAEQVDYVIKEAVNPDNLALLYEGWTPWV